jgi:hypothetical protein
MLPVFGDTLIEHGEGDGEDDDLVECERHRGRGEMLEFRK